MNKKQIATLKELSEGKTVKFEFERSGKIIHAFAANFRGTIVAYQNVCRHIPIPLDYADNRFFNKEGSYLVCQNHGANFDPLTGLCVQGPCEGQKLHALKVEVADDNVWLV